MRFDLFQLRIDPDRRGPAGGAVEIWINGRRLLDTIRELEGPFAAAEREQRNAEGEKLTEADFPPGDYHELSVSELLLPSRELLGEPAKVGFVLSPGDPQMGKATILGCTCGITDCWFLQVRVTLTPTEVVWSDFGQFHREGWKYNLGPFVFDRTEYEAELAKTPDELTHDLPVRVVEPKP